MPTKRGDVQEFTFTATVEPSSKPKRSTKEVDKAIEDLKREREMSNYHEQNRKYAEVVWGYYDCLIEEGFSEEQAFELIKLQMMKK